MTLFYKRCLPTTPEQNCCLNVYYKLHLLPKIATLMQDQTKGNLNKKHGHVGQSQINESLLATASGFKHASTSLATV